MTAVVAQPPARPAPTGLTLAFGDPRAALEVKAGSFASTMVAPGKSYAITASEKEGLTLEGKSASVGPRQVTALVRLRTDVAPNASAQIDVGRADAKDSGIRVSLSTARDSGAVSCSVTLGGKPLHDLAALSKAMDWGARTRTASPITRAYPFKDIRPGLEDYRARIEADMACPDVPDKWLPVRFGAAARRCVCLTTGWSPGAGPI